MKTKIKTIFLFVLVMSILAIQLSCKSKQAKPTAEPEEKCAFFTLTLMKDSVLNKTTAEVTRVNIVDSKVRYIMDEAKTHDAYFLKIQIVYPNNKTVSAFTEHPLYKRLDLYSEDGKIESKLISLSQGEVTLRVPSFGKYKKLILTETVNFKERTPVILKNEK